MEATSNEMISELHFKTLENANRELAMRFEKLRKASASRDTQRIKHAAMEYFQAVQRLNTAIQDALSKG